MKTVYENLTTEKINKRSAHIDRCSTRKILNIINEEDKLVPAAVEKEIPHIEKAVDGIVPLLRRGGRLFYFGAGTSGRIGVLDASECPPTYGTDPEMIEAFIAGGDTALRTSVENAEDSEANGTAEIRRQQIGGGDAVVGITASGETPYVLAAARAAKAAGAFTIGLCNNADSGLSRLCDVTIAPIVGPEVVTGSTRMKAGTSAKLVLNMLTTATMIRLGKVYGNLMVDVNAKNKKLYDRMVRIVREVSAASEEEVRDALEKASLRPKVAIVMLLAKLDCATAEKRLEENDGLIAKALEKN